MHPGQAWQGQADPARPTPVAGAQQEESQDLLVARLWAPRLGAELGVLRQGLPLELQALVAEGRQASPEKGKLQDL